MQKKRYGFFLSEEEIDYLKEYKNIHGCSSQNEALDGIIKDHMNFTRETRKKEIDELANKVSKKVVEELKGMKLGIDNTDRNTQILIEMVNGRYIKDRVGEIPTTSGLTTKFARKSEALETAENEVKKRIHRAKVMKSYE